MNPAHAHLFGYERPCELIGKSWRVLYRPEDVRKFETEVFPKLGRDGHWHDYPTGVKKDGTDIPEEVSLTLLPGGGLVCFCMDNSERLNALESLRTANASLQRSAKFKDQVLANMSHELRTPLNAVIGMTESLQLGIYGKLAAPQVRPTEVILSSARHLLALINDVLDLAKIEAGKLEVRKSRVDMKDLTESVLCMIRDSASAKSLRLHLQIPDNLPPLFTDERRLKQILVNLLDNAVKFTPNGRSVGLKVVRSTCPDQTLIDVWDEGIGIPLADQERLFQPFVQLDTGYGRRFEGTGLGLSLVNRLTQMLGGVVRLQSEEGRGARFIIVLPDDLSAPQSADARAGEVAIVPVFPVSIRRDRNPLLLLVEDNQPNAEMLKAFVLAIGYRVTHVNSGEDALQEVDRERPEAILMDIQMPGMDGWETTRRLKSNPTTAEIPVIAVTALAMPEDRARCAAAGVNAFFAKPLKLRELAEALQKWVPA
jgi:PAS domain S-box-containing protein